MFQPFSFGSEFRTAKPKSIRSTRKFFGGYFHGIDQEEDSPRRHGGRGEKNS
jgi:hypothetical protein